MAAPKRAKKQLVKAKSLSGSNQCLLQIRVFDGTRNPLPDERSILYRVIDANQRQIVQEERGTSLLNCAFDFHDNFMDSYTVIVSASDYKQAGFTPVRLSPSAPTTLDLMLIPRD